MSDPTFAEGDFVRFKPNGRHGYVSDINPAAPEDRKRDEEIYCYLESQPGDYTIIAEVGDPDELELITRKADIPPRVLPTLNELREHVQDSIHGGMGPISVTESDRTGEPDGELLIYGTSASNMPFQARIRVLNIEGVDL